MIKILIMCIHLLIPGLVEQVLVCHQMNCILVFILLQPDGPTCIQNLLSGLYPAPVYLCFYAIPDLCDPMETLHLLCYVEISSVRWQGGRKD